MQQIIAKNDAKTKPSKVRRPQGRRAQSASKRQGVPPETPGQGSLLQVIIIIQTNIRQTIKKQSPKKHSNHETAWNMSQETIKQETDKQR